MNTVVVWYHIEKGNKAEATAILRVKSGHGQTSTGERVRPRFWNVDSVRRELPVVRLSKVCNSTGHTMLQRT